MSSTRVTELQQPVRSIQSRSKSSPEQAPPGRHLHYILAPCPHTGIGPAPTD